MSDLFGIITDTSNIMILIIVWVCVLTILSCIALLFYMIFDTVSLPIQSGSGIIYEKKFQEEYTSTTMVYNAALKQMMPSTQYHDEAWKLVILINNEKIEFFVDKKDYPSYKQGSEVKCEYTTGRLSKDISIEKIA